MGVLIDYDGRHTRQIAEHVRDFFVSYYSQYHKKYYITTENLLYTTASDIMIDEEVTRVGAEADWYETNDEKIFLKYKK